MARTYYPVMLDLRGRLCLVVGGGAVAARKVEALVGCGARVAVVAPEVDPGIARLGDAVEVRRRAYQPGDLDGVYLAIAASDRAEVNAAVWREAQARGILVNVVDDPERCTFVVPAVVRRGPVSVAISTSGSSPALAAHLRRELERVIGPEYGLLAELLARLRPEVMQALSDPATRRRAWQAILESEVLDLLRRGDMAEAERRARACIASASAGGEANPSPVVAALRKRFEEVRAGELRRFGKRLSRLSEKDQALVENLTGAIVNDLIDSLAAEDGEAAAPEERAEALRELFDLKPAERDEAPGG